MFVIDWLWCLNIDRVWDKIFSIVGYNIEVLLCF